MPQYILYTLNIKFSPLAQIFANLTSLIQTPVFRTDKFYPKVHSRISFTVTCILNADLSMFQAMLHRDQTQIPPASSTSTSVNTANPVASQVSVVL
jgi:hypothetical protein